MFSNPWFVAPVRRYVLKKWWKQLEACGCVCALEPEEVCVRVAKAPAASALSESDPSPAASPARRTPREFLSMPRTVTHLKTTEGIIHKHSCVEKLRGFHFGAVL